MSRRLGIAAALGCLVAGQSSKEAKFDQFRCPRVRGCQLIQHFIKVEEIIARFISNEQSFI